MVVLAQRVAPPQRTLTDQDLVAAARCGSDLAFEELYHRYAGRIRGFVARLVADQGRVEDLTQEIFLNAVRRLRATDSPVAFKPWVFEIARNACIDEFRRSRRGPEVPLEDDVLEEAGQPAASPSPEATVAARQQLDDLRGAFHGLSPQHHRLLVLRELEGRSYEDIGSRLGMSRPMVESGLFRARRKLHREYDELVTGRRCVVVQAAIADGNERDVNRLGVRQRRDMARHLAHCQPCRRVARAAGLADHWLGKPTLTGRIAALLPVPWLRWRAGRRAAPPVAPLRDAPQLQSFAGLADPAAPLQSLGRAAAAFAAILVAGAGGSVIVHHPRPIDPPALPAATARTAAAPATVHHGPRPERSIVTPVPSRAARSVAVRAGTREGSSRPPAGTRVRDPRHDAPTPATEAHGAPPASSPTPSSPAIRILATAAGSASAVQSAGAVLRTEAGLAQAALATAQSVAAVPTTSADPAQVASATDAAAATAGTAASTAAQSTAAGVAAQ